MFGRMQRYKDVRAATLELCDAESQSEDKKRFLFPWRPAVLSPYQETGHIRYTEPLATAVVLTLPTRVKCKGLQRSASTIHYYGYCDEFTIYIQRFIE